MARRTRPRGAQPVSDGKVVVRMYRVGFGDCFVIFIPHETGTKKVLIDCGTIKRDPTLRKSAGDIAKQLVKDITEPGESPRFDLVIATHRHKDHVGGFADDIWQQVDVGEVWMPWTEADDDQSAINLRRMQEDVANALNTRLAAGGKPALAELAANSQTNQEALHQLKEGFNARDRMKPRYLGSGPNDPKVLESSHLPGVRIHVLGPPRDVNIIARDLPRDEEDLFLRTGLAANGAAAPTPESLRPFGNEWVEENPQVRLDDKHIEKLKKAVAFDPESSLAAVDDSLNNTSIVLVFEIGGRFLLFPGDAQWGPWEKIMGDKEAVELLRKVSFYKVSHHASHNGTPRDFVNDIVGRDCKEPLIAMSSVTPHGGYGDIPRRQLMEALENRFDHIAISDVTGPQSGFTQTTRWSIDFEFDPDPAPVD